MTNGPQPGPDPTQPLHPSLHETTATVHSQEPEIMSISPTLRPHRHSNLARKSAFVRLTRRQSGNLGGQYPGQRQQETRLQRKCSDNTGIRSCAIRRKRGDRRWTTYRRRLCPLEPPIASLCMLSTHSSRSNRARICREEMAPAAACAADGWMIFE